MVTTTPTSLYVATNGNTVPTTSDEASWLIDVNNQTQTGTSLEGGFFSGYWPYGNAWTNNLVPYYTINDGKTGNATSTSLLLGHAFGAFTYTTGSGSPFSQTAVQFDSDWGYAQTLALSGYQVSMPGGNHMQGEVTTTTATYMGGGSGETLQGLWSDGHGWYLWGYNNDCSDSPYSAANNGGASTYANGGY